MESQRIAGRYQVLRAVGRGGMGVVWLCRDEVLGREVAVKQIGGLPGEPEVETARAMREARSAAALNHANAVSVYDVVDHEGRPYLVMEYVEGRTLADVVTAEGPLPAHRVADIGAQLASALAAAHNRGIVHRDVKPGNVLLDVAGRPKISDFGIARGVGDDKLTQTGLVSGTPAFLSPELARGGDPDPASDVWALGATLYVAAEGQAPYESRPNALALLSDIATRPPRPMTHVGGPLAAVVLAMMDQDRAARPDMTTVSRRLADIARAPAHDLDAGVADTTVADAAAGAAVGAVAAGAAGASSPATRVMRPVGPEQLQDAAPAVATPPPVPSAGARVGGAVPTGPGARRHRGLVPLVVVLVLAAAIAALYALTRPDGSSAADGTPGAGTTASSPAKTTPSSTRSSSTASSSSSTTSRSSTASSSSTRSSAPPARNSDQALAAMVTSYFHDVTRNRDVTWAELTPKEQAAAGGRTGYETFWSSIASVAVGDLKADADKGRVDATLTYTRDDGSTSTERHRLDVLRQNGRYLIDSDHLR